MLLYGNVFPPPSFTFLVFDPFELYVPTFLTHFNITTRRVTQYVCNADKLKTSLQTYAATVMPYSVIFWYSK